MKFWERKREHKLAERHFKKMTKTFNQGGQRRTLKCPCGYTIVGSVREANGKHKLHLKVCVECKDLGSSLPSTAFNRVQGDNNGWNGYAGSNKVTNVQGTIGLEGGSITQVSVKSTGIMQGIKTMKDLTSVIA